MTRNYNFRKVFSILPKKAKFKLRTSDPKSFLCLIIMKYVKPVNIMIRFDCWLRSLGKSG